MAATFINLPVSVSLKNSPDNPLHGRVKEVIEETATLVLNNGTLYCHVFMWTIH